MTPEQQRIKIAETCGWKRVTDGQYESWVSPEGYEYQVMFGWQTYKDGTDILPDYLNDLNAMHEAVRKLTDSQRTEFRQNLTKVWTARYNATRGLFPNHDDSVNAPAKQRAEAFLSLWEE
jgi:hypothetical protein